MNGLFQQGILRSTTTEFVILLLTQEALLNSAKLFTIFSDFTKYIFMQIISHISSTQIPPL